MANQAAEVSPWPAWRYGPGEQSAVFEKAEDVPEGWEDAPQKVGADNSPPPEQKAPLKRAEIVAALKAREIAFESNEKTKALYDKLIEAIERNEA